MATNYEKYLELLSNYNSNCVRLFISGDWYDSSIDIDDIHLAYRHSRPQCIYSSDEYIFCPKCYDCIYCKSWKYIHGNEESIIIERQHIWKKFWSTEDQKELLKELAQAAQIACYFRMNIKEELIAKAWHPSRFVSWCLDTEEYLEWIQ